jgi:hypothetical protein
MEEQRIELLGEALGAAELAEPVQDLRLLFPQRERLLELNHLRDELRCYPQRLDQDRDKAPEVERKPVLENRIEALSFGQRLRVVDRLSDEAVQAGEGIYLS